MWYLALTVALGVAALVSGNNVLLLLECLLLGGVILSGILSEWTVARVSVHWHPGHAYANEPCRDRFEIESKSPIPLFFIDIGMWRNNLNGKNQSGIPNEFQQHGTVVYLPPRGKTTIYSDYVYPQRGVHNVDNIAVATAYPFGLAKKYRLFNTSKTSIKSRLIWPSRRSGYSNNSPTIPRRTQAKKPISMMSQHNPSDVLREWHVEADHRQYAWLKTDIHGNPAVRLPENENQSFILIIDLDELIGNHGNHDNHGNDIKLPSARRSPKLSTDQKQLLENALSQASHEIHRRCSVNPTTNITLQIRANRNNHLIHSRIKALDQLATIEDLLP
jgi:hypothetical protein